MKNKFYSEYKELFGYWEDLGEKWFNEMWSILDENNLICYSNSFERIFLEIRVLALANIFTEFKNNSVEYGSYKEDFMEELKMILPFDDEEKEDNYVSNISNLIELEKQKINRILSEYYKTETNLLVAMYKGFVDYDEIIKKQIEETIEDNEDYEVENLFKMVEEKFKETSNEEKDEIIINLVINTEDAQMAFEYVSNFMFVEKD